MDLKELTQQYDFTGKAIVITGATAVIGGEISCALVGCGANVAMMDRNTKLEEELVKRIETSLERVIIVYGNVLRRPTLEKCAAKVLEEFGRIDCLVNAAGGNYPDATTNPQNPFFDLPEKALRFTSLIMRILRKCWAGITRQNCRMVLISFQPGKKFSIFPIRRWDYGLLKRNWLSNGSKISNFSCEAYDLSKVNRVMIFSFFTFINPLVEDT